MSLGSRLAWLRAEALAIFRRPAFREGARDGVPMAIGIAAWGLVAGVAMAKSGMGIALAIFMSVLVYAGSAQIAALPLISAGAPMWVVWASVVGWSAGSPSIKGGGPDLAPALPQSAGSRSGAVSPSGAIGPARPRWGWTTWAWWSASFTAR